MASFIKREIDNDHPRGLEVLGKFASASLAIRKMMELESITDVMMGVNASFSLALMMMRRLSATTPTMLPARNGIISARMIRSPARTYRSGYAVSAFASASEAADLIAFACAGVGGGRLRK